jgi:AraC-like DNA-binding protein
MGNSKATMVNWGSQKVLSQIADQVNKPLSEITRLLRLMQSSKKGIDPEIHHISAIIMESSVQIEQLIEHLRLIEQRKQVHVRVQNQFQYSDLYQRRMKLMSPDEKRWLSETESTIVRQLGNTGFNAATLSDQLGMSERTLNQKLERLLNCSANVWIRNLRMYRAKDLLENRTFGTVNELAFAVGLKDPHYFSSQYKNYFGKKPKDYL